MLQTVCRTHENECLHRTRINVSLSFTCTWISLISMSFFTPKGGTLAISRSWSVLAAAVRLQMKNVCLLLAPTSTIFKADQSVWPRPRLHHSCGVSLSWFNLSLVAKAREGPSPWRHAGEALPWGFGQWQPSKTTRTPHLTFHLLWYLIVLDDCRSLASFGVIKLAVISFFLVFIPFFLLCHEE